MLCIKNESALKTMAEGGKILASCLELLGESIKPGMSTLELDKIAYKLFHAVLHQAANYLVEILAEI